MIKVRTGHRGLKWRGDSTFGGKDIGKALKKVGSTAGRGSAVEH